MRVDPDRRGPRTGEYVRSAEKNWATQRPWLTEALDGYGRCGTASLLDLKSGNRLLDMVEAGTQLREIASHFRVDVRTVSRWKKILGFEWQQLDNPGKSELPRLWRSGMTQREIGDRLGVTATTVRRWRREIDLEERARRPSRSREEQLVARTREVRRLTRKGYNDGEIAALLGLTQATVARHRRSAGWYYRSPGPIDPEVVTALFNNGQTDAEIAVELDTTPATIQVKRSRIGLLRTPKRTFVNPRVGARKGATRSESTSRR